MIEEAYKKSSIDVLLWIPVDKGLARSIIEIQEEWSVEDIYDAIEYCSVKSEVEAISEKFNK